MDDKALYLRDSYLKVFEATAIKIGEREVVLDKTAFYPASGGQPSDTGALLDGREVYKVISVKKIDGEIVHELDRAGLSTGDKVKGTIDWARRYRLMRMHTAAHLLASVFHSAEGALITGNQLDLEKSRIDFSLEEFDRERIEAGVAEANKIIKKNAPVKVYWIDKEEALKDRELFKLAAGFKHDLEKIRIVEIEGVDRQADGGTHVSSLSEIGKIEFLKVENKGKSNRRVYFTVN